MQSGVVSSLSSVLPTSQVFTSGYVNTETILHFFYKITNERGTKTVFTYSHVKWFYGQSEHVYYLNYFMIQNMLIAFLNFKEQPFLGKLSTNVLKICTFENSLESQPILSQNSTLMKETKTFQNAFALATGFFAFMKFSLVLWSQGSHVVFYVPDKQRLLRNIQNGNI